MYVGYLVGAVGAVRHDCHPVPQPLGADHELVDEIAYRVNARHHSCVTWRARD